MTVTKEQIKIWLDKYSFYTHAALLFWNAFIATWGTGTTLDVAGVHVNARNAITWLQATMHMPTWVVFLATLFLNASLIYSNLKTQQATVQDARKTLLANAKHQNSLES